MGNRTVEREQSEALGMLPTVDEDVQAMQQQRRTQFSDAGTVPPVALDADGAQQLSASDLAFGDAESGLELQEAPELAAEGPAVETQQTPQTPAPQDGEKKDEPRLRIKVPLSEPTKQAARRLYAQYVKTGVVPPVLDLREKISLDWIQAAGPMDRVRASMLYDQFKISDPDPELLAELVGLRALPGKKARGQAREPVAFYWVSSTSAVYQALRVGRSKVENSGGGSRLDTGVSGETLSWMWGLLQGDFNKDQDTAQTVINGVAGLIPGLDQVLDARDLTANLKELVYDSKYNEAMPWFNFVTTLIGAVPEVGSVIKTVARLGARAAGNLAEPVVRILRDWAPRLGGWVMEQAHASFRSVMSNLETLLATAGAVSSAARAWVQRLLDNARAALAQLATRAQAALATVRQRLDELISSSRKSDEVADTPTVRTESAEPTFTTTTQTPKSPSTATTPTTTAKTSSTDTTTKTPTETTPTTSMETTAAKQPKPVGEVEIDGNIQRVKLDDGTTLERETLPNGMTVERKIVTDAGYERYVGQYTTKQDNIFSGLGGREYHISDFDQFAGAKKPDVSATTMKQADDKVDNLARRGEMTGANEFEGTCFNVAVRNSISAELAGLPSRIILMTGWTPTLAQQLLAKCSNLAPNVLGRALGNGATAQKIDLMLGRALSRFGLDGLVDLLNKHGLGRESGHAIAEIAMPDGSKRYISWGTVKLRWEDVAETIYAKYKMVGDDDLGSTIVKNSTHALVEPTDDVLKARGQLIDLGYTLAGSGK